MLNLLYQLHECCDRQIRLNHYLETWEGRGLICRISGIEYKLKNTANKEDLMFSSFDNEVGSLSPLTFHLKIHGENVMLFVG